MNNVCLVTESHDTHKQNNKHIQMIHNGELQVSWLCFCRIVHIFVSVIWFTILFTLWEIPFSAAGSGTTAHRCARSQTLCSFQNFDCCWNIYLYLTKRARYTRNSQQLASRPLPWWCCWGGNLFWSSWEARRGPSLRRTPYTVYLLNRGLVVK